MFSKHLRRGLGLSLVACFTLTGVACSKWIDGKKKDEEVIELNDERLKCMNSLPAMVQSFVAGNAVEKEIRNSFGCVRDGFRYFRERTRGSMADGYTAQDLRQFFNKYFLKENNISIELAEGIMKAKSALLGGSETSITKPEIDRLIELLKTLEDSSVNLAPHVKILFTQERGAVTEERLVEAIRQVQKSLLSFLDKIDLEGSGYTFEDAQKLLSSMGRFIAGTRAVPAFDKLSEWIPVLEATKLVFFGERASITTARDWSESIQTLVDLYEIALRFHYLIDKDAFSDSAHLHDVIVLGDKVLSVLERCNQMRSSGRIPFAQIDLLIDRALGKSFVKLPLSAPVIKDLYRKIVVRILDPIRRGDSRGADALERVHLLSVRREFNVFRMNQAFVDDLTRGRNLIDLPTLQNGLATFNTNDVVPRLTSDSLERTALNEAWTKYKSMMGKTRSMILTDSLRVPVVSDPENLKQSWRGLTFSNLMHTLVRGFMMGYGDHRDPAKAGCTEALLYDWYEDFRPAATELRAFDPRSGNSGPRSHKEASFFTYSGNGDARADMDEMYEFLTFLVGGGFSVTTTVRDHMVAANCSLHEIDILGSPYLDEACFKKELRSSFSRLFANLPGLAAYVDRLNDKEFGDWYSNLISAARDSDPNGGKVELSDLRTAVMIMHYTESLFVGFDADRNGLLSVKEILAAAPRFYEFLKTISPIGYERFIDEAFLDLVQNGKRPGAGSLTGTSLRHLLDAAGIWSMKQVPRANLFKVFAVLKADLAGKKK